MTQITIAMAKGRLAEQTMELMEALGIDVSPLKEKSRKLVFESGDGRFRYIMVKPSDVPTYVDHGVADVGIVGKDTLMEENRPLYEMLDLGFGKCRMAEAAPVGFREDRQRPLRVATKYPAIARRFYAAQSREIEIIKLNGSIELAPLLELSDVIVDIVETGTTLRQNNLEVTREILPISARFIANKAAMKFKEPAISRLLSGIQAQLNQKEERP